MSGFRVNCNKILEILQAITKIENFLNQKRKLKDIELMIMNLTAEYYEYIPKPFSLSVF
ncbi:MAG: hypothetical protein L3J08_07090 [Flavobacteriaceae bacterium]|nr:hypothetical protein [Flavobacteriaceae bacterium]